MKILSLKRFTYSLILTHEQEEQKKKREILIIFLARPTVKFRGAVFLIFFVNKRTRDESDTTPEYLLVPFSKYCFHNKRSMTAVILYGPLFVPQS